ncbi:MAG: branched-chain amino acid ABC transporter permease [Acidobacteriota bacterium]
MDADTAGHVLDVIALIVSRGSLYALIAAGFALVLGAGRVLNLFHGSFFLLGAYGAHYYGRLVGGGDGMWTRISGDAMVAGVVGLSGLAYYYLALRPSAQSWLRQVTTGLAGNLLVAESFRAFFGTRSASVPPIIAGTVQLGPVSVLAQELAITVAAVASLGALSLFLRRSRWGNGIRAVAQDAIGARLVGVNPTMTIAATVALSGAMAGLAGALAAPVRVVRSEMWSFALLKALTVVIVGGVGSLRGTCLASYGLAAVEVSTTAWQGESVAELFGVLVAVGVLVLRPRGVLPDA